MLNNTNTMLNSKNAKQKYEYYIAVMVPSRGSRQEVETRGFLNQGHLGQHNEIL